MIFNRFGLPRLRLPTGILEVLGGVSWFVGLKWTPALRVSSAGLATLVLIAFGVRLWMGDSVAVSLPSLAFTVLSYFILFASLRLQAGSAFSGPSFWSGIWRD